MHQRRLPGGVFSDCSIGAHSYYEISGFFLKAFRANKNLKLVGDTIARRLQLPEDDSSAIEMVGWIKSSRVFPAKRPAHLEYMQDLHRWRKVINEEGGEVFVEYRSRENPKEKLQREREVSSR